MLFYGRNNIINILSSDTLIFNISSMNENIPRLQLIPPNNLGHLYDRDFDIAYANYIMSNDMIFVNFFTIIYNIYLGKDVCLIYSKDDWSENLAESINKLIQQRYGYNAIQIETFDDYIFAKNHMIQNFNSDYGLFNLDSDKERFTYLSESARIHNGGIVDSEV